MTRSVAWLFACAMFSGCAQAPGDSTSNAVANSDNGVAVNAVANAVLEPASDEGKDVKVAGTDFNAVGDIPCGMDQEIVASCSAGVKRNGGPDGTSFVEVTKPDGSMRVLFFQGANASGADSSEADGSAKYRFLWHREEDWTVIRYGPERYRVPDALVLGG